MLVQHMRRFKKCCSVLCASNGRAALQCRLPSRERGCMRLAGMISPLLRLVCFGSMHVVTPKSTTHFGDMHWSPVRQCIATLEPALIDMFIRHSSNFHSETQ